MAYTSTGGPKGLGTFIEGASTLPDLNELVGIVADVGNVRTGTAAERDAFPTAKRYTGLRWEDTDSDLAWTCVGTTWVVSGGRLVSGVIGSVNGATWAINRLHRQGRQVTVHGYVTKGSDFGNAEILGQLPAGFRPVAEWSTASLHYSEAFARSSNFVQVNSAGEVRVNLDAQTGRRWAFLVGTWVV